MDRGKMLYERAKTWLAEDGVEVNVCVEHGQSEWLRLHSIELFDDDMVEIVHSSASYGEVFGRSELLCELTALKAIKKRPDLNGRLDGIFESEEKPEMEPHG